MFLAYGFPHIWGNVDLGSKVPARRILEGMRAIQFHEYGGPEVLRYEEVQTPAPGQGEVVVKVHATSVNPIDWKIRAGYLAKARVLEFPYIPGWDFSGTIAAAGEGVSSWKNGDEVFGHPQLAGNGTYAEYVCVPASICARKPASIDHIHAGAIPLVALTAWQALFEHANLQTGHTVLIQSGAGGVGTFAIQFAKAAGARVVTTASARNFDLLRELGADEVIDYNTTRFEDVVSNVDLVVDGMAGEVRERSWKTLKPGGILVALTGAPPNDTAAGERGVRQKTMLVHPDAAQLTKIAELVDSGKVRVIVDAVVPLPEAARAHQLNQSGHTRGKIVIQVV